MAISKSLLILLVILLVLLGILQYQLWFSSDGMPAYWRLKHEMATLEARNKVLEQRNQGLVVEIVDLKKDSGSVEAHARTDLGMVKPDETFYQTVPTGKQTRSSS